MYQSFRHQAITYVPEPIPPGVAQLVRFPSTQRAHGSTKDLLSEMETFLSKHLDQDARTVHLLIAFVFASWFMDCFHVAPVIRLDGPDSEVSLILRLLNTLCYHPALIGDLDSAALALLPAGLRATLLIDQPHLLPRVQRALLASARRDFYLVLGSRRIDLFGARALHCDSVSGHIGMNLSINPRRRVFPSFTEKEERASADDFQSKLLAYRIANHAQVKTFELGGDESYLGFEDEMTTWLAALPKDSELKNSVLMAFAESNDKLSAAHYEDPKCLVAEAALMFCHREGCEYFYVYELAEKVNDLLTGRHADSKLENRKIGSVLDQLGISKQRVTKGYRVKLTPATRDRIHRVALAYGALSARPDSDRCAVCKAVRP